MKKKTTLKKIAEQKIKEFEKKFLSKLLVRPQAFVYIDLYHTLQQLHFQGEYKLVVGICGVAMDVKRKN